MLSQRLILKSKWSFMERAAEVSGSTKFQLKGKKGKGEAKVDMAKERSKVMTLLERYGKVLHHPYPKAPVRSEEEVAQAKKMMLMRNRKLQEREFLLRRRETVGIRLRTLAVDELPTESLKAAAALPDLTPFPKDFIFMSDVPPLEDQEIFGQYMTGIRPDVDDFKKM